MCPPGVSAQLDLKHLSWDASGVLVFKAVGEQQLNLSSSPVVERSDTPQRKLSFHLVLTGEGRAVEGSQLRPRSECSWCWENTPESVLAPGHKPLRRDVMTSQLSSSVFTAPLNLTDSCLQWKSHVM